MLHYRIFLSRLSQTLLQERAPEGARGRVFAVQFTLGNLFSIIPLLVIGGLADLIGIALVLVLIAIVVMAAAWLSRERGRGVAVAGATPGR